MHGKWRNKTKTLFWYEKTKKQTHELTDILNIKIQLKGNIYYVPGWGKYQSWSRNFIKKPFLKFYQIKLISKILLLSEEDNWAEFCGLVNNTNKQTAASYSQSQLYRPHLYVSPCRLHVNSALNFMSQIEQNIYNFRVLNKGNRVWRCSNKASVWNLGSILQETVRPLQPWHSLGRFGPLLISGQDWVIILINEDVKSY